MLYKALKNVINGRQYDYESTLSKMDIFLLGNRITEAEYTELKAIMDAHQAEKDPGTTPTA